MEVDRGSSPTAKIYFDESTDKWYIDKGTGVGEELTTGTTLQFVDNETKTFGATTVSFQLTQVPVSGTLKLYFNGQRWRGAGNDFSLANSTVTLVSASATSLDVILCDYRY